MRSTLARCASSAARTSRSRCTLMVLRDDDTAGDAPRLGLQPLAQRLDVGARLQHLRVAVAQPRAQLLQPGLAAADVGLQLRDDGVVQHLLHAVARAPLACAWRLRDSEASACSATSCEVSSFSRAFSTSSRSSLAMMPLSRLEVAQLASVRFSSASRSSLHLVVEEARVLARRVHAQFQRGLDVGLHEGVGQPAAKRGSGAGS